MNKKALFSCLAFLAIFNSNAWANRNFNIPSAEHFYVSCTIQIIQAIPYELRKKIHWDLCFQRARAQSVAALYNIPLDQALRLVPL